MDKIILTTPTELKEIISQAVLDAINSSEVTTHSQPQPQSNEDQLLRISQLAVLLSVSKQTIHNWKKQGLIPFHRISNKVFFKKSEVLQSLKKSRKVN